jgi:hypothetical protein
MGMMGIVGIVGMMGVMGMMGEVRLSAKRLENAAAPSAMAWLSAAKAAAPLARKISKKLLARSGENSILRGLDEAPS